MPSEIKPETPALLWVAFLWHRNCASPGPPGRLIPCKLPAMLSLLALGGLFALESRVLRRGLSHCNKKTRCRVHHVPGWRCPSAPLSMSSLLSPFVSMGPDPDHRAGSREMETVTSVSTEHIHSGDVGNGELRSCPAPPPRNTGDLLETNAAIAAGRRPDAVDAMAVGAG